MSDPILTPEAVKALRDAGPKDLLWLICDSHELLRAERDRLHAALTNLIEVFPHPGGRITDVAARLNALQEAEAALLSVSGRGAANDKKRRY